MPKVRNLARVDAVAVAELSGGCTIARFATSTLLDELTGAEIVVLVRLMRSWWVDGAKSKIRNVDLHPNATTARSALAGLVEHGLIKIKHGAGSKRTIERRR